MKFTVASNELQKVLTKISGVVPSKSTLPILENILFSLKKNELRVAATDLEVSISATIDVKGSEDGAITVPAKRLMETIRSLPDVQIVLTADTSANRVKLITENGEYTLMGESSEEFPSVPQFKGEREIGIDMNVLKRMITKTVFAASADELRPSMTGMLFQSNAEEIRCVATDGHRLVRFTTKGLKQVSAGTDIVIPSKALSLLTKSAEENRITMTTNATHVQFQSGRTSLTSRLIEEKYPNYESVIPLDNEKTLTVDREPLVAAVRRVGLYSSSTTHQIRFSLKKDEMRVAAEDIDFGGEAKEKLRCRYSADEMEIGFNANYVIDMLTHLDSDEVTFRLSSPVRAAVMSPGTQKEGEDILMLVMPVRLNA